MILINRTLPQSVLSERERQFASILWRSGTQGKELGRRDLHRITGVQPTPTGNAIAHLIGTGLVRDGTPLLIPDRGRPRIGVEIDPDRRIFLGLSISPGEVRLARLDPLGRLVGEETVRRGVKPAKLIQVAAKLLKKQIDRTVFAVGVTVTGVVDPQGQAMVFSSAVPSASPTSLEPVFAAAGRTPIILDNDLHALGARWLLSNERGTASNGDRDIVLLVGIDDGRLGASVSVNGRTQPGCVLAANELGHTRLPVETAMCFCGQTGCLERIVSSEQLKRFGAKTARGLSAMLARPGADADAIRCVLDHLATGLANAVNFILPQRLVIASPFVRHAQFTQILKEQLPLRFLPGIRSRVQVVFWEQSCVQSAEHAAWLALADVFGHPLSGSVDSVSTETERGRSRSGFTVFPQRLKSIGKS